ncbi:T9SS type A sorting domain-containing protein, partial [Saprospiraceae bacterium]|nr:T9SS type A sorting domain-containing protein [Saprospiraceae bacterium]
TENTNSALADVSGSSVAFSDVDGDDDQDLFIIGRDNENVSHSKLYLNDGAGNFSESLANAFQPVKDGYIAFADVDGDADQDLLVTGFNGSSGDSRLYINDGVGNFSEMLNTPFHQVSFGAVAFADIDSDEDMDLFITGANPFPTATASMYLNDGNGNFTEDVLNDYDAVTDGAIAFADFDEDGRQDLVITGWSGAESVSNIFMNDGVGNLEKLPTSPFRLAQRSSIAVTDIDGDEDQDLIITGWEGEIARSTLYKNGVLSSISAKNYNSKLDFSILPNPSTSNKIRLNYYSARTGIATVKLLDLQGNIILKKEAKTSTGEQTFLIDISSVPSGMYLVQVTNNGLRGIQKLVVK